MRLDRAAAALALLLTATLLPAAPAVAQSPSVVPASPGASPAAPVACPAMTDASAPVRDSAATLTLGFGAANPDPAIGGFHPGEDWALPAGSAPLAVFAVGDGQVIAVQPAVSGGRGGLVVVSHTGPFDLPAAASDAAVAAPASTEATILTVYAGIDPADDLVVGACVDGDTQLGTTTAQCAADVPEPCSELPSALHLEVRLAATADPANRSADWSVVGTAEDSIDGWFLDAATMTADGLRDPSAFLATLAGGGPIAGLDELLGTDGRLTVLLLGSDRFDAACTDRGGLGGERTDTIMFATINPRNGKVAMASLPRDTIQVPIGPGQVYGPKITGRFGQLELNSGNRNKARKKMCGATSRSSLLRNSRDRILLASDFFMVHLAVSVINKIRQGLAPVGADRTVINRQAVRELDGFKINAVPQESGTNGIRHGRSG